MRFNKTRLKKKIETLEKNTEKFHGLVYRVVQAGLVSNFGVESIIAGRGPKEFQGGRWMAKGVCYVLYASFSADVAIREIIKDIKGIKESYIIAALAVKLNRMVDLTRKDNLKTLEASVEDLVVPHYSLDSKKESYTQRIGRCAYEAGIEGLKVPSAVNAQEANLVVFSNKTPVEGVQIEEWEIFDT